MIDNAEILSIVKIKIGNQLEISDSNKEYSNNDVLIKITTNKEIEPLESFEISEDRKILSRVVTENESNIINLKDLSGNSVLVKYNITNIDKISPEIIGIEDGKIYSDVKNIEYKDNIGIRSVYLNKYDELENRYKKIIYDINELNNNSINNLTQEGSYKIVVIDLAGNKTECRIKISK